jgi:hypothetical protein
MLKNASNGLDFQPVSFPCDLDIINCFSNPNVEFPLPIKPEVPNRKSIKKNKATKYYPPDIVTYVEKNEGKIQKIQPPEILDNQSKPPLLIELLKINIFLREELVCVIKSSETEKFEITGFLQSQTRYLPPNSEKDELNVSEGLILDVNMSGTRNSVNKLDVNRKLISGEFTDFSQGLENSFSFRVRTPIHVVTSFKINSPSPLLKYVISPNFKVMILKASCHVSCQISDNLPKLKLSVKLAANPNFRDTLRDITILVSMKRLLYWEYNLGSENDDKDDNVHSRKINIVASNQATTTIREIRYVLGPQGNFNLKESIIAWSAQVLLSGASLDIEAEVLLFHSNFAPPLGEVNGEIETGREFLPSEIEALAVHCPVLPIIVQAQYKDALISKTRFHVNRTEYANMQMNCQTQENLSSKLEYRFLD